MDNERERWRLENIIRIRVIWRQSVKIKTRVVKVRPRERQKSERRPVKRVIEDLGYFTRQGNGIVSRKTILVHKLFAWRFSQRRVIKHGLFWRRMW